MIHLHLSKKGKNFVENKEIGSSFRDTVNTAIEATRGAVVASIYIPPSGEWRDTLMYRVFFNREPDATGKKNWMDALDKGVSRKYVFAGFANSQEWKGLCDQYKFLPGDYTSDEPRDQNIEVTAFVQRLYTLCLSRKADNKGMNDWTAALNSKKQDGAHVKSLRRKYNVCFT